MKNLFQGLIPDFCIIDNYNSRSKSSSSDLDLEFLPVHIVSVLKVKKKLKDNDYYIIYELYEIIHQHHVII